MQRSAAEAIAKKNSALKHCTNLLAHIERHGSVEIKLGATGLILPCKRGDAVHTLLQSIRFALIHEINSIEIVENARPFVAPYGASEAAEVEPHRHEVSRTCPWCGKEFVSTHPTQKYCSPVCSSEARKKWKQEYMREYLRRKALEKRLDKDAEV
jgi:endogenous inhibitor of DNA gyrase (YacG/DUF329 family)